MVSCSKCGFDISQRMRFALVKNFCPSCGGNIISESDYSELSNISKKLRSQEFISELSQSIGPEKLIMFTYDLSVFIKFDLNKDIPSVQKESEVSEDSEVDFEKAPEVTRKIKPVIRPISRKLDAEDEDSGFSQKKENSFVRRSMDSSDEDSSDLDDASEYKQYFQESSDDSTDERVRKLKNLYKNSPLLKKQVGVTRSS